MGTRKKRVLTEEQKRARDERFQKAVARMEADPEYTTIMTACRIADSVGRMDWMTVCLVTRVVHVSLLFFHKNFVIIQSWIYLSRKQMEQKKSLML